VSLGEGGVAAAGAHTSHGTTSPTTTLLALDRTIQERREALAAGPAAPDEKPSWTAKLLTNPELLCKKVGSLWHNEEYVVSHITTMVGWQRGHPAKELHVYCRISV
jgi:hypothetical protein